LIEPNSTIFRALTTLLHRPNVQEVLKEFPLVLARDTSDFALLLYLLRAEVLATRTPLTLDPRCCRVRSLTRSLSPPPPPLTAATHRRSLSPRQRQASRCSERLPRRRCYYRRMRT